MVGSQQLSQALEDAVAPDIIRETEIEATAFIGKEAFAVADVTVDIGKDFPSLVIEAERTRGPIISLALDAAAGRERPETTHVRRAAPFRRCARHSNPCRR